MKKILPYILVIAIIALCALNKPTEESFYVWLKDQHDLTCGSFTCRSGNETVFIETGSHVEKGYLFFHTIDKTYENENGKTLTIKVLGILQNYYPIVEEVS
ncbi:hypothetical protein Q73_07215 [Bacillus coahuilensis m2-6]|uniref:hypothetical protein n=1 Tax=Bacillus coahuilensis TaxID=408580 RepID=UPI0007503E4C|nr:hypothetical protein [Bacillus coahuilensis]KUP08145.1 hypothetical protein Q73_07215 [Bacillus coahuilensis m2-6]